MAKGISIKFQSYESTIPTLLNLIKLPNEIKKYDKIVIKPYLSSQAEKNTPLDFVEYIVKFCIENKNPVAEIFIAEGADGVDTWELFDSLGYKKLAEKYSLGLVDLNETDVSEVQLDFLKFDKIMYPKILSDSFIISLTKLSEDSETDLQGSLSNMLAAFPAEHYKGFFSATKNKIRKWPIKFSVQDIVKCKMPQFAIIDASEKGLILAGNPLEIDKQAAKLLGKEWKSIPYLRLIDENLSLKKLKETESLEAIPLQ